MLGPPSNSAQAGLPPSMPMPWLGLGSASREDIAKGQGNAGIEVPLRKTAPGGNCLVNGLRFRAFRASFWNGEKGHSRDEYSLWVQVPSR